MDSLYTNEVREFLLSRDWPISLKWTVEEFIQGEMQFLQFVLYRHNLNTFKDDVVVQLANTMNEMFMQLRNKQVPIYLEVRP